MILTDKMAKLWRAEAVEELEDPEVGYASYVSKEGDEFSIDVRELNLKIKILSEHWLDRYVGRR